MNTKTIEGTLQQQVSKYFKTVEVYPGVFQLLAPYYHADGDMIDIFIKEDFEHKDKLIITDLGLTLMRLSYTEDIENITTKKYLHAIVRDNRLMYDEGELSLIAPINSIASWVGYFAQSMSKVMGISSLDRSVSKSIFQQEFNELILSKYSKFNPDENISPVNSNPEYAVDYLLTNPITNKKLFIYPVNNDNRGLEALSSLLFFKNQSLTFLGIIVFENLETVTSMNMKKLMGTADKMYPEFKSFVDTGQADLARISA